MKRIVQGLWWGLSLAAIASWAGDHDYYRYTLEEGKDQPVCTHMTKVFNQNFKRPWDISQYRKPGEAVAHDMYPRMPGVTEENLSLFDLDLETSKFPTSPEFDAVPWREARLAPPKENESLGLMSALIALFDIDNDGKKEWVMQRSFMRTWMTGSCRGSGFEDTYYVFDQNAVDLSAYEQPLPYSLLTSGSIRAIPLDAFSLFGEWISARSIRPFIFDRITYLSAYGQGNDSSCRQPYTNKDTLRILKYVGVKEFPPDRRNVSLNVERVCRIRMNIVKQR